MMTGTLHRQHIPNRVAQRPAQLVEAEARAILTAGLSGEDVPMSVLLAADTGHDIDFEPERLGLTARTRDL